MPGDGRHVEERKRLNEHLANQPFPHFESARGQKHVYVRIDADGSSTSGRFVDREFNLYELPVLPPESVSSMRT